MDGRPSNRSIAIQMWVIGALVPLAFILTGPAGEYDFAAFWVAGRQLLDGAAAGIYSIAATQGYADGLDLSGATIFPYPPHALFLYAPLALIGYIPAYLLWNLASAAFFYAAARPYLPQNFPVAAFHMRFELFIPLLPFLGLHAAAQRSFIRIQ